MTVETKKLLLDVREAGESILGHTVGKTLADYTADRFFRRAVEREFEISAKRSTVCHVLTPPQPRASPKPGGL